MKKLNIVWLTVSALALIGCGGGGSPFSHVPGTPGSTSTSHNNSSDPWKTQNAVYTLHGGDHPTCNKPYRMSGIESNSDYMTCTWLCGEYEGARPVTVVLTFEKTGGIWELTDDSVSTASDYCHN